MTVQLYLNYHPGSKNTKLDALSRQFAPDHSGQGNVPLLSLSCVVRGNRNLAGGGEGAAGAKLLT